MKTKILLWMFVTLILTSLALASTTYSDDFDDVESLDFQLFDNSVNVITIDRTTDDAIETSGTITLAKTNYAGLVIDADGVTSMSINITSNTISADNSPYDLFNLMYTD